MLFKSLLLSPRKNCKIIAQKRLAGKRNTVMLHYRMGKVQNPDVESILLSFKYGTSTGNQSRVIFHAT